MRILGGGGFFPFDMSQRQSVMDNMTHRVNEVNQASEISLSKLDFYIRKREYFLHNRDVEDEKEVLESMIYLIVMLGKWNEIISNTSPIS